MKWPLLVMLLSPMLASCSRDALEGDDRRVNTCVGDADCASGVCRSDGLESFCVTTKADLGGLYLDLDLPADSPFAAGLRIVDRASNFGIDLQGTRADGFVQGVSLGVAVPVTVRTNLTIGELPPDCMGLAGSPIPASMRLYPVGQPIGVALPPYDGVYDETFGGPTASVPVGIYDVVLEPDTTTAPSCWLPPLLLPERTLSNATDLYVKRGEVAGLDGHLDIPFDPACATDAEACFRVELLDNRSGRSLARHVEQFAEGALGNLGFRLRYFRPDADEPNVVPVLVVRPPSALRAQGMPELYWKLGAIDPDGDGDVSLELAPLLAATTRFIPLEASVRNEDGDPAAANVLIVSRQLLGGAIGDNAVFQASLPTDTDGNFAVNVLPGKYDVVAVPASGTEFALTNETWTFADNDLGKGRTLELRLVSRLAGTVVTTQSSPLEGLAVQSSPAVSEDVSLLEAVFSPGQSALLTSLPRTSSASTNERGAFELPVDPGRLDLFVKPERTSNLPWLVRRSLAISATDPQALDLGELRLRNPAVLVGEVVTPDGMPLPDVTVRAWLSLPASSKDERPSAVTLGEATSDATGRYRLLLPPSVAQ
ncbi:MAG: hypothetical protein FJ095_13455 [Deltaproteobacteria bacterium]|nr:hypothetical protein [Deltaproteobacteria bacterium]